MNIEAALKIADLKNSSFLAACFLQKNLAGSVPAGLGPPAPVLTRTGKSGHRCPKIDKSD